MNTTPATTLPLQPEFTGSAQTPGLPQPEPDVPAPPEGDPPLDVPGRHEPPSDPAAGAAMAPDDREIALSRPEARAASPRHVAAAGEEDAGGGLEQLLRPIIPLDSAGGPGQPRPHPEPGQDPAPTPEPESHPRRH